jgi:hypothetical protein
LNADDGTESGGAAVGAIRVMKVVRLTRLLRTVRLVAQFRKLWLLIRGLVSTLHVMGNALLLLGLILYVYACLGVELIASDETVPAEIAEEFFGSVPTAMLTMFQLVVLDNTMRVCKYLSLTRWYMVLYFLSFIMLCSIALMNLLTAIVVEGSLDQARNDREIADQSKKLLKQRVLPQLYQIFLLLDEDGSGQFTMDELQKAPADVQRELQLLVNTEHLEELFDVCDIDDSGSVSVEEFFDGICKIISSGSDQPLEMMRAMKYILATNAETASVHESVIDFKLQHKHSMEQLSKQHAEDLKALREEHAADMKEMKAQLAELTAALKEGSFQMKIV